MKHDFPDKIIFLDIDGVINTEKYHFTKFDERCMDNLLSILHQTNAKIVVSSSWRDHDNNRMINNFIEHGCYKEICDNIIDITIRGYKYVVQGSKLPIVRGNEIKHWIDTRLIYPWHSNFKLNKIYSLYNEDGSFKMMNSNKLGIDYQYVILDDDTDMLYDQKDNFIKTRPELGLNEYQVKLAVKILNNLNKTDK